MKKSRLNDSVVPAREFVADKIIINTILISGPRYGIIFRTAHIKAIASEFSIPKINNRIKYKTNKIVI